MWVVDLEVPFRGSIQAWSVGAGSSEVLGDRAQRRELPRRPGGHLGSIGGDREQDRSGILIGAEVDPAVVVVDGVKQPLGLERGGEGELDLGGGLL